ncbi:MAG TPA: hypothetical protein VGR69_10405 [Candidatus Rubrimentiphilum sp.]|nr:hypothetical protein [Candidatus Rubrimentiphilum sp.]
MTVVAALITVLLSPWKGASLPTAPSGTEYSVAYAMHIRGAARQHVVLDASNVAPGWIAAFCTSRLCSPFHSMLDLDSHGNAFLEFSLIRTDPKAARHTHVVVRANSHVVAKL